MKHEIVIDIDYEDGWKTVVVEMTNTIENPNKYIVHTTITNGYETLCEATETKNHEQALKYIIDFKKSKIIESDFCCGFYITHKQTLITEKNPYISEFEFIKRFLWE